MDSFSKAGVSPLWTFFTWRLQFFPLIFCYKPLSNAFPLLDLLVKADTSDLLSDSLHQWRLSSCLHSQHHLFFLFFGPFELLLVLKSAKFVYKRGYSHLIWGFWTNEARDQSLAWRRTRVVWESGIGQRRSGLPSVESLLLVTIPEIPRGHEWTENRILFFENFPLFWSRRGTKCWSSSTTKKRQQIIFQTCCCLRPSKLFELKHVFFLIKLPK